MPASDQMPVTGQTPDSVQTSVAERLRSAAIEVFGARGYTASRVSDIVGAAGVAQGTFYLYFDNKEAIFLSLIDDFFGRLLGQTLGRYSAADLTTPADMMRQFRQMWRTILTHCRQEPVLTALVLRESYVLGPQSRARVDARFNHIAAAIQTYLEAVAARGIIRLAQSAPTSWAVLGIIERAIHYAVVIDPETDVDTLADAFVRMELGGLLGVREIERQLTGSPT